MAKKFEFGQDVENGAQTSLVNNFSVSMLEKYNFSLTSEYVPSLYKLLFRSVAIYLKTQQNKNVNKAAFKFLNAKGEFRFGAILKYQAPEEGEEEETGNWMLSFTFNEEDLEGADVVIDNHKPVYFTIVQTEMYSTTYSNFDTVENMHRLFEGCIDSLLQFLDANSNDGEDVELEMPGIFTAYCGFEDGAKVYSITPGATVKQLIKDDDKHAG